MTNFTDFQLNNMGLKLHTLKATELPQTIIYAALHNDYSELDVYGEMFAGFDDGLNFALGCDPGNLIQDPMNPGRCLSEKEAGERAKKLCAQHKHWGPFEHVQIVVNMVGFPHTALQQLRTHRLSSWDIQSGRYTGQRIEEVGKSLSVEDVFFVRPVGFYNDRHGHSIEYTDRLRRLDINWLKQCAENYKQATSSGMPYEMARDLYIPYCIRQNAVFSVNLRSALHVSEMRSTKDASPECQWFTQLFVTELEKWCPEILGWWKEKRMGKNLQSP